MLRGGRRVCQSSVSALCYCGQVADLQELTTLGQKKEFDLQDYFFLQPLLNHHTDSARAENKDKEAETTTRRISRPL